jgi:LacI family transcriptional regulator
MSTINDVAELAGVSVTTVSHALSGKRPVAIETRKRIADAVERLGYQPSQLAIAMLTGRTMTLGALVPDIKNPFFGELLSAVESAADSRGYGTIVSSTELRRDHERRQVEMLCAKQVDAILLIGCSDDAAGFIPAGWKAPVVVVDQMPDSSQGFPTVRSDHERGGRIAADHLCQLGHREVGVLAGPPTMLVAAARLHGFLDQMKTHGLPVPRTRRIAATQFTLPSGLKAAHSLLTRRPELTAIFCANDLIAYGALHAASELDIDVPRDLSVIGFDDIFVSSMVQPTLTTIHQEITELGRRSVALAVQALAPGDAQPIDPLLEVSLVVRSSTATARTQDRPTQSRTMNNEVKR